MKRFKILFAALVVMGFMAGLWVVQTRGQVIAPVPHGPINVYATKFLCGTVPPNAAGQVERGPVKPGNYLTAINIHNPYFSAVPFVKKAVLMYWNDPAFQQGFEIPRKPGDLVQAALEPDWGMEIDCDDIRQVLLKGIIPPTSTAFIKGWVVIETPGKRTLDIVTAYTSYGLKMGLNGLIEQEGFALDIEPTTTFTQVKPVTAADKAK